MEQTNVGRAAGEPLVFSIDLKWSLWSEHEEHWQDYAPQTFAHLRAILDEGALDESGDTVVIQTAPRKEIRFGTVTITASRATVRFREEFDEGPPIEVGDEFALSETPSLRQFMARVDGVEAGLLERVALSVIDEIGI